MSEVATETAVIETPVAETVVPTASEQVERSAADRRQAVRERAQGKVAAQTNNVHHSAQQPRNDAGQFAADESPAPEGTAPEESAAVQNASPEAAPEAPPAPERIELPPNHWARGRGKTHFDQLTPDEVRGTLNDAARKADLDAAQQEVARLRAENARLSARAEGWQESGLSLLNNPEISEKYNEIKKVWGEEDAEIFLDGIRQRLEGQVNTKLQQVDATLVEQRAHEAAEQFLDSAYSQFTRGLDARITAHPAFAEAFGEAAEAYDAVVTRRVERGDYTQPTEAELWGFVARSISAHPVLSQVTHAVLAEARQNEIASAKKQAEAAARAAQQQELEALAAKRRTNGLGRLPAQANVGQQVPINTERTAAQIREQTRLRARGRV